MNLPTANNSSETSTYTFLLPTVLLSLFLFLVGSWAANATTIGYVFSATGDGKLGSDSFTNRSLTITGTTDTTKIRSSTNRIYRVTNWVATVTVSGLPPATLTTTTYCVNNQNIPTVGISDPIQAVGIVFVDSSKLSDIDFSKPIGPVAGTTAFSLNVDYPTTSGPLSLYSVTNGVFQSSYIPQQRISSYVRTESTNTLIATNCIAGVIYSVESEADLMGSNWATVQTGMAQGSSVTNALATFTFISTNSPASFYRVVH